MSGCQNADETGRGAVRSGKVREESDRGWTEKDEDIWDLLGVWLLLLLDIELVCSAIDGESSGL